MVVFRRRPQNLALKMNVNMSKELWGSGDRVKVEGGKVYLNGNLLDEKFLPDDFVTEAGNFARKEKR